MDIQIIFGYGQELKNQYPLTSGTHTVFIEFSAYFALVRGQIVFSIVAQQQSKLS